MPPCTVVFFAANPARHSALDLRGEVDAVSAELRLIGLDASFRIIERFAASSAVLQRTLLDEKPTIVQFIGHGVGGRRSRGTTRDLGGTQEPDGVDEPSGVVLHSENEMGSAIASGRALGDLFATVGASVRLVVLNACHSAEQADALVEHVDFVVGVSGEISDVAAKAFSVAFYRGLAHGQTIQTAFSLGVNILMLEGRQEDQELPTLVCRSGVDPSAVALVAKSAIQDDALWDVFISYAEEDDHEVRRLATELHDRELRVFFAPWEISVGSAELRRYEEGIARSRFSLIAVSPHTMSHARAWDEYGALLEKAMAQGASGRLIPVRIGEGEATMPPFLRTRRGVDLRGKTGEAYAREVEGIVRALRGQPPGPPPRRRR